MSLDIPGCKQLDISKQFCFPMPGGGQVCSMQGLGTADLTASVQGMLAQISAALGPLGPIFTLLDVALALIQCIQSVKDCLGPPPDPSGLVKCIEKVVSLAGKILAIIPQVWIPLAVKHFIEIIVSGLEAFKNELQSFIRQQQRLAALATAAGKPGNGVLQPLLDCAQGNFDIQLANTATSFGPLNQIIGIVNGFMDLGGLPKEAHIPEIGVSGDPAAALDQLDPIITTIKAILDKIPG